MTVSVLIFLLSSSTDVGHKNFFIWYNRELLSCVLKAGRGVCTCVMMTTSCSGLCLPWVHFKHLFCKFSLVFTSDESNPCDSMLAYEINRHQKGIGSEKGTVIGHVTYLNNKTQLAQCYLIVAEWGEFQDLKQPETFSFIKTLALSSSWKAQKCVYVCVQMF